MDRKERQVILESFKNYFKKAKQSKNEDKSYFIGVIVHCLVSFLFELLINIFSQKYQFYYEVQI